METKNKIIKMAQISYIVTKVLYYLTCISCLVFIVLAIVLPTAKIVDTFSTSETAVLFGTLAFSSFMLMGLLWNVESLFKSVTKGNAPFGERVSHYLQKCAIFTVLFSLLPAIVGTTIIHIVCPTSELVFPISFSGVIIGVVVFMFGLFFKYGKELQQNDDETL